MNRAIALCLSLLQLILYHPISAAFGAQDTQASPPRWATYMVFFERVWTLELTADRVKAMGGDDRRLRSEIRREAGLTEREEKILKEIAADSRSRQQQLLDERTKLVKKYSKQDWLSKAVPLDVARRVRTLSDMEMAVPDAKAAELKEQLGPDRFSVLDAYIRVKLGRHPYYFER